MLFDYSNSSSLCGIEGSLEEGFGSCFQKVFLSIPLHFALAVGSAFYIGVSYQRTERNYHLTWCRGKVMLIRTFASFLLTISFVAMTIQLGSSMLILGGWSSFLLLCCSIFAWSLHCFCVLYITIYLGQRSPAALNFIVVFTLLSISLRSIYYLAQTPSINNNSVIFIVRLVAVFIHLLSMLKPHDRSEQQRTPLLGRAETSRTVQNNVNSLSYFFFLWVNPLIEMGYRRILTSPNDVFKLPSTICSAIDRFEVVTRANYAEEEASSVSYPLLRMLFKAFGLRFIMIGLLKLVADCAGFCSPLFLQLLLSFIENSNSGVNIRWGYLYVFGLTLTTVISAFASTHFNLLMSILGYAVRSCLIDTVYRKTLKMSNLSIDDGQVINFMSTDTDRIVNFFPSLHALWSLPFQFFITIYLLYCQLGVSCLAGLILAILMIPLNKVLAIKIGHLSTKMMSAKDDRIEQMSQILQGINIIKCYMWESFFKLKTLAIRERELNFLKSRKYLDAGCVFMWATTPVLISVVTFATFVLLGNDLNATVVFTSVALFAMLTGPLNAFPWVLNGMVESRVSFKRMSHYLSLKSLNIVDNSDDTLNNVPDDCIVSVLSANFVVSVNNTSNFRLVDISMLVRRGEFVGIVGKVGSGKSCILLALLGELEKHGGDVFLAERSSIGYVQQQPWLQKGTIRYNILFDQPFELEWYTQVVNACALTEDFEKLKLGDNTDIGEAGSKLSGGQKARVALARAVYQKNSLYLIDDIFSALDESVAKHIYNKCILGILGHTTRILCTHRTHFLNAASCIYHLESNGNNKTLKSGKCTMVESFINQECASQLNVCKKIEDGNIETTEESQERGVVRYEVYKYYYFAMGVKLVPCLFASFLLMQITRNLTDFWLARWASKDKTDGGITFYLTMYGLIAVMNCILSLVRAFLFAYCGICAARLIHARLLDNLLIASTSFYNNIPKGRILNRISSDIYTVDDSLPFILNIFLANVFGIVIPIGFCMYAVPWITLILIPLFIVYFKIQQRYRPVSRDLKRITSISLSPIYAHFNETLSGLVTIRSARCQEKFIMKNRLLVELNLRAQFSGSAASRWLELRLQLIGCIIISGIALISIIQHHLDKGSVNPSMLGLAISYALGITAKLSGLVISFTETEKEFVAVERCLQYIKDIPVEDHYAGISAPHNWPTHGKIKFEGVSFGYRPDLPLVLNDVNFEIKPHEKIGIIGRTGAGKSSIFEAIFRTSPMKLPKGRILIDDIDIAKLRLCDLRRHLCLIPQNAYIFSGDSTFRSNLDPLEHVSDDDKIWRALQIVGLSGRINELGGLYAKIGIVKHLFSAGQFQLFAFARSILSDAKIVCIDEATSNVDIETSRWLFENEALKEIFRSKTVLTIAHRFESISDCDRIFEVEEGEVVSKKK